MTPKLNQELTDALRQTGGSELEVVDPATQRVYFLVDSDTHRRAMEALRRVEDASAIAEGIAEMDLGQGQPLDEAFQAFLGSRSDRRK